MVSWFLGSFKGSAPLKRGSTGLEFRDIKDVSGVQGMEI